MREVVGRLWTPVACALLLLAMALASALLIIPNATEAIARTISTGSMRPSLEPGTLVVARPTATETLQVGDAATDRWESGDPTPVTRRVTQIGHAAKSGTHDDVDPPVSSQQVTGRVSHAVPHFGWASNNGSSETAGASTRWTAYGFMAYGACLLLYGIGVSVRGSHGLRRRHRPPVHRGALLAHAALIRRTDPARSVLRAVPRR